MGLLVVAVRARDDQRRSWTEVARDYPELELRSAPKLNSTRSQGCTPPRASGVGGIHPDAVQRTVSGADQVGALSRSAAFTPAISEPIWGPPQLEEFAGLDATDTLLNSGFRNRPSGCRPDALLPRTWHACPTLKLKQTLSQFSFCVPISLWIYDETPKDRLPDFAGMSSAAGLKHDVRAKADSITIFAPAEEAHERKWLKRSPAMACRFFGRFKLQTILPYRHLTTSVSTRPESALQPARATPIIRQMARRADLAQPLLQFKLRSTSVGRIRKEQRFYQNPDALFPQRAG